MTIVVEVKERAKKKKEEEEEEEEEEEGEAEEEEEKDAVEEVEDDEYYEHEVNDDTRLVFHTFPHKKAVSPTILETKKACRKVCLGLKNLTCSTCNQLVVAPVDFPKRSEEYYSLDVELEF